MTLIVKTKILNDPNYYKTPQKNANVEIINCLSKLDIKQNLLKNEAFYFSGAISVVEIIMALASAIKGIKTVAEFTKGMLEMSGPNSLIKYNKNKINDVDSVNRMINKPNNPPKKENDENYNDNKGNILIKKKIRMNYSMNTKNTNLDKHEINSKNSSKNHDLNIGTNLPKNKRKNNMNGERSEESKEIREYNSIDVFSKKKAEFIPPQYNTKFFKPNDKGVIKRIKRSQIPFKVDKNTKILLEYKKNVLYDINYLKGPFYDDQNIIEIIEDSVSDNSIIIHYTKNNSKVIKFGDNKTINDDKDFESKKNIKNSKNVLIMNEINQKQFKNEISNSKYISGKKDFIKIRKINTINNINATNNDENNDKEKKVDRNASVCTIMKREHMFLRTDYEKYLSKKHPSIFTTLLVEILDKIYFIKIFVFLRKYDIFSVHFALYMFYHILWLSFICGFFTVNTIKKIWTNPNFPSINFYLLYGFISNVIVWVIYKIFTILLDNQDKIRSLVLLNNENILNDTSIINIEEIRDIKINKLQSDNNDIISITDGNKQDIINNKYEKLIRTIRIQMAIFYIVILLFTGFCFSYLTSFFAIYTGTKEKVLKTYYISIIEIFIIKFVYGLSLGALRIGAEVNELKILYNFVYICDKYLS